MSLPSTLNQPARRVPALDGLRGVAAVTVVFWHVFLLVQSHLATTPALHTILSYMEHSPLKILIAGDEAVVVFFILSGLVLTLPVLQRENFSWSVYYPARLLRLYLPVWAALAFSFFLLAVIPRLTNISTLGGWLDATNSRQLDVSDTLTESLVLLTRDHYPMDNPLWSIWWEVVFSLLLPVFIAVALVFRKRPKLAFAFMFILLLAGALASIKYLQILPLFGLGVLTAMHRDSLRSWLQARSRGFLTGWALLSVTLLILWQAWPRFTAVPIFDGLLFTAQALGGWGIVLAVYSLPLAGRIFGSQVPHFLGRISYSLYLIHVPVLVSLAYLFGPSTWVWPLLIGFVLLGPLSYVFMRFIELPSLRFGREVGALALQRFPRVPFLDKPLHYLQTHGVKQSGAGDVVHPAVPVDLSAPLNPNQA